MPRGDGSCSNPRSLAQVPRLDWTDAGGVAHSLTQSLAIIEFLCDACNGATKPSLLPNDAIGRARCRQVRHGPWA